MIVYLDLDRTMFRTAGSGEVIFDKIAELFTGFDVKRALVERDDYYVEVGDLYYHDMSKQLSDNRLEPDEVYAALRQSNLADGRFQFDGCDELIQLLKKRADVRVFTFGPDDFQRFKASLCPALDGLTVITTMRPKAELLRSSPDPAWLVDDKPIGDQLPDTVQFIQVSLEGASVSHDASWPLFYSLREVKEFFNDAL